jgi:hypothetical protein
MRLKLVPFAHIPFFPPPFSFPRSALGTHFREALLRPIFWRSLRTTAIPGRRFLAPRAELRSKYSSEFNSIASRIGCWPRAASDFPVVSYVQFLHERRAGIGRIFHRPIFHFFRLSRSQAGRLRRSFLAAPTPATPSHTLHTAQRSICYESVRIHTAIVNIILCKLQYNHIHFVI